MPKKYFIKTFGCQANIADSGSMAGTLDALGFEELALPAFKTEKEETSYILENADLFIINSCSVRQKSEDKVYGIGKVVKESEKRGYKKPFIILSGCMVGSVTGDRQRYAFDELKKKTLWVSLYINPSQVFEIADILKENDLLDEWALSKINSGVLESFSKPSDLKSAFVNISYGCDNFCTYCVVPYSRGKEISRDEKQIIDEIHHLVNRGIKEITLCGQNVNSWGLLMKDKFEIRTGSNQKLPFADLLRKIHEINDLEKISFISSNPFDFTNDLVEAFSLPKISNYAHIAVQSGNNDILKKMNRRHTVEDFISLVSRLKKTKPNVEIGTDFIVGFPGETEEQFNDTVELVKKVKFAVAFISMYSPRKGTPAEKLYHDNISLDEKKRRHRILTENWKGSKKI